jgi:hypothetical protein
MSDISELDELIESLRRIGDSSLPTRIASEAAPRLHASLKKTLGAGQSPEGVAWAPRKEGGQAYQHAAEKITTKAVGDLVQVTLVGPEAYGHYGARGMPVRQMLPDAGAEIPKSVTDAIKEAAKVVLDEATR